MAKFIMTVQEEDGTISQMAKELQIGKNEVMILALNVLDHILTQRKAGRHIGYVPGQDKTADILNEATAGVIKFKLNT